MCAVACNKLKYDERDVVLCCMSFSIYGQAKNQGGTARQSQKKWKSDSKMLPLCQMECGSNNVVVATTV
jgi:hypothetical protein